MSNLCGDADVESLFSRDVRTLFNAVLNDATRGCCPGRIDTCTMPEPAEPRLDLVGVSIVEDDERSSMSSSNSNRLERCVPPGGADDCWLALEAALGVDRCASDVRFLFVGEGTASLGAVRVSPNVVVEAGSIARGRRPGDCHCVN